MIICIDFDGTCVTHDFPNIGKDIGAQSVLKKIVEAEHKLVLFTIRGEATFCDRGIINALAEAVQWFEQNEIPLHGINIEPEQHTWTSSQKAYEDIYIDDSALGCPLTSNFELSDRPYVNWIDVEHWLQIYGII